MSKNEVELTKQERRNYRKKAAQIIGDRAITELGEEELKQVRTIYKMIGMSSKNYLPPLPKNGYRRFHI